MCACLCACAIALCAFLNGARVQPFITRADCRQGNAQISRCSFLIRAPAAHWTFLKAALTLSAPERDAATTLCLPTGLHPVTGTTGFVPRLWRTTSARILSGLKLY